MLSEVLGRFYLITVTKKITGGKTRYQVAIKHGDESATGTTVQEALGTLLMAYPHKFGHDIDYQLQD